MGEDQVVAAFLQRTFSDVQEPSFLAGLPRSLPTRNANTLVPASPVLLAGQILRQSQAKGLVEKIPHSRRYRLVGKGYSICVAFFKLFEKIYAPLTAGLLAPFRADRTLAEEKRCTIDRLYQRISDDLDALFRAVRIKVAA